MQLFNSTTTRGRTVDENHHIRALGLILDNRPLVYGVEQIVAGADEVNQIDDVVLGFAVLLIADLKAVLQPVYKNFVLLHQRAMLHMGEFIERLIHRLPVRRGVDMG